MGLNLLARDACAWPILTRLANGALGIVYHNRPSHGFEEGDLAALRSDDGGATWECCGLPAPHEAGSNRVHSAAGVNHRGDWVVLSTGHRLEDGNMAGATPVWYSQLRSGESTWRISKKVRVDVPASFCIPHGRILAASDGRLAATVYRSEGRDGPSRAWVVFSGDGGASWGDASELGDGDVNEVVMVSTRDDYWLAAARTHWDHHLDLFSSRDQGRHWSRRGPLTLPMQHPGDLTALGDGRLLLTYGIRNRGLMGIGARLSIDGGRTWRAPVVLRQFSEATDCGYPSTVVLDDGDALLTACYTDSSEEFQGYQLLALPWRLGDFFDSRALGSISDGGPLEA